MFAENTATQVSTSLLPADFWQGLLGTTIYFFFGLLLLVVAWRVIDWITPGDLNKQILGTETPDGKPNVALAILAGLMFLGLAIIVAVTIH